MVEGITESIVSETVTPAQTTEAPAAEFAPQDNDLAQKLAILSKKEKGILSKNQEIQAKLKEIEEKNSRLSKWEEYEKLVTENPMEFFKQKGLSFEQVQQKMLESLSDEDIDPIQKQLKELSSKLASKDKEIEELLNKKLSEKEESEKAKNLENQSKHYQAELNKFLDTNKDEYELVNAFGASEEVFNVIKEVYLKTSESGAPKLMTFKEASDLYEKKLVDTLQSMKELKKVKSMFGSQEESDILAAMSGISTIDDSFTQSSSTSPELKTEEERVRAAAKLFEQQMKSL
jgi:DNA repair exonuclease SbcCD ATPase subunit